jgi:GTP-binding protein
MIPAIAIVGRPNVGKSTLFNCLTQSRDAVVADIPGVTRDRQYGHGKRGDKPYVVIDTGGMGDEKAGIEALTIQQAEQAITEANVILFVVDARRGMVPADKVIAKQLRKLNKPILLVVNKIDDVDPNLILGDFHGLGLTQPIAISAVHQRGIDEVVNQLQQYLPEIIPPPVEQGIKIAIAGKPNVGKSTLVNRMLGEERVIVYDLPGTTRDSIYIPLERFGKKYTVIDTAGLRRRSHVTETLEKISIVKTLQSIEEANVVIFLIDARSGVTEQDLHLLGFIIERGKALVVAVNKWDGLTVSERADVKRGIDRRLPFIDFAKLRFISALHGTGVGDLFEDVQKAYASATKKLPTPVLNEILHKAIMAHQPPMMHGHRIKLRYAHAGGHNPPLIIIHGNQVNNLPDSYRRYLINFFRKALRLVGTPIRFEFKEGNNPFKNKSNKLTESQRRQRQRMIVNRKQQKRK